MSNVMTFTHEINGTRCLLKIDGVPASHDVTIIADWFKLIENALAHIASMAENK